MEPEDRELLVTLNANVQRLIGLMEWAKPYLEKFISRNPFLRLGGR